MRNIRKRDRFARFLNLALGSVLLVGGTSSTILQVAADDAEETLPRAEIKLRDVENDEKIYGINAFDEIYSRGVVFRTDSMKISTDNGNKSNNVVIKSSNSSEIENFDGTDGKWCPDNKSTYKTTCFTGTNTTRKNDIYIDVVRGAILDDRYLDIREYIWVESAYGGTSGARWGRQTDGYHSGIWYMPDSAVDETKRAGAVYRELHFYETGTDNEINENAEIEFKGVMTFSDFEFLEGYNIKQGYHQAYLQNPTFVKHDKNNGPGYVYDIDNGEKNGWMGSATTLWLGPGDNENQVSLSGSTYMLWVEVESKGANQPLLLEYIAPSTRGSGSVASTVKVAYNLVGENPTGVSAPTYNIVARYGTLTPSDPIVANPEAVEKYTFSGWYYDEAMTQPVIGTVNPGQNIDLYGKYVRDDVITIATSITDGEITDPIPDADAGEDYEIKYKCNDGYELSSISVDGTFVDIAKYPISYILKEMDKSHKIGVVCEKVEQHTKVPNTGFGMAPTKYTKKENSSVSFVGLIMSSATCFIGLSILIRAFRRTRAMSFKRTKF